MTTRKPPTIAVLWGDQARAMNWMELHDDGRTECVATADPNGFWMRNTMDGLIAEAVYKAWLFIQSGADSELATWATHALDTTHYPSRCVPIPFKEKWPAVVNAERSALFEMGEEA